MFLVNLIELETKNPPTKTVPAVLGFSCLLIALVFACLWRMDSTVINRPLEIDEREILLSAIDRLTVNTPEMTRWTGKMKQELLNGKLKFTVMDRKSVVEKYLIEEMGSSIVVSVSFFESDPLLQERSLMHLLSSELAVLGD